MAGRLTAKRLDMYSVRSPFFFSEMTWLINGFLLVADYRTGLVWCQSCDDFIYDSEVDKVFPDVTRRAQCMTFSAFSIFLTTV